MSARRESNFELLRLISMLLVLGFHVGHIAIGSPRTDDLFGNPINACARIFGEQACAVCVNLFVFISGWFGINPTRKKLASLLFQVFFLSALITLAAPFFGIEVRAKHIIRVLIIGCDYWFVISYLVLFLFAPLLNKFIEQAEKRKVEQFLVAFFIIASFYSFFFNDIGHFSYGFSPLWFMGLYILARYIRLWPCKLFTLPPVADILIYLVCTFASSLLSIVQIRFEITPVWMGAGISYNNPLVVIASVFFFLAFSKLSFHSRVINWFAPGAFAIYIIHCHPLVFPSFLSEAAIIYNKYSGINYCITIIAFIILVALICTLVDKLRALIWNILSIFSTYSKTLQTGRYK